MIVPPPSQNPNPSPFSSFQSHNTVMSSPQKLISCLGHMLTKLTQQSPQPSIKNSKFYCKTKPIILIQDYLKRIHKFAACSQYIFLKALIYIDRFQNANIEFVLNQYSVHRQIICAIMLAAKYSEDFYYTNKHYSKVGGISQTELSKLQLQFLQTIDFQLYVPTQQLSQYQQKLNSYYDYILASKYEDKDETIQTQPNSLPEFSH